jgi:hypothetical protein
MTRLEQIDFENEEKFMTAIKKIIAGEEAFRTYKKNDENKQIKIISNHRLYVGNNFSININKSPTGKIYLSIDYFSVDTRFDLAKKKNESL